jgi:hypothetical protein
MGGGLLKTEEKEEPKGGKKNSGNAAKPAPQLTLQLRRVAVTGFSLEQVSYVCPQIRTPTCSYCNTGRHMFHCAKCTNILHGFLGICTIDMMIECTVVQSVDFSSLVGLTWSFSAIVSLLTACDAIHMRALDLYVKKLTAF